MALCVEKVSNEKRVTWHTEAELSLESGQSLCFRVLDDGRLMVVSGDGTRLRPATEGQAAAYQEGLSLGLVKTLRWQSQTGSFAGVGSANRLHDFSPLGFF